MQSLTFEPKPPVQLLSTKTVLFAIALTQAVMLFVVHDYSDVKTNFLRYDAYGYYLYLPAVFIENDLDGFDFTQKHHEQHAISPEPYQIMDYEGQNLPFYPSGLAWMWLPFFLLAHGFAIFSNTFPADGMSLPYHVGLAVSAWFYALFGFFCLKKVLLKYVSESVAAWTMVLLFFGTNLFFYQSQDIGLTHGHLFALYAALLAFLVQWHERPSWFAASVVGFLAGLLVVVRASEVLCVVLPLLYSIFEKKKWQTVRAHWRHIPLAFGAAFLPIFPQLLLWKSKTGQWIFNAYAHKGWGFDWASPQFKTVLLGFEKGWLLYTPLMLLAVLGLFFLHGKWKAWRLPITWFFLLNVYLLSCYDQWNVDSGFGARAFVGSYAVLALPLAAFLEKMSFKKGTLVLLVLISALGIFLNLFQNWQTRQGILRKPNNSELFYKTVFFKTEFDLLDRRFLFLKEKMPNGETPVLVLDLGKTDAHTENVVFNEKLGLKCRFLSEIEEYGFSKSHVLTESEAKKWSGKWVRTVAEIALLTDGTNEYNSLTLVFELKRPNLEKPLKWVGVPVQQCLQLDKWTRFGFEMKLPEDLKQGDVLNSYFWRNGSPDTLFVR